MCSHYFLLVEQEPTLCAAVVCISVESKVGRELELMECNVITCVRGNFISYDINKPTQSMNKTIKHLMCNCVTSDIAEKDVDTHTVGVMLTKTI